MTERSEALSLVQTQRSTILATLGNESGQPEASYTPFIQHDKALYIFISKLASHTQNILSHKQCTALIIEDEQNCKNIFARKRLNLRCQCEIIHREEECWNQILTRFEEHHGNTVALLKTLPDFYLIRCTPEQGSFIKGFGQAFAIEGNIFDNEQSQLTQIKK